MKGSYVLVIYLEKNSKIKVGKKTTINFLQDHYAYIGSALNGLEQRIERHLRDNKKFFWNIDYFLKYAKITNIFYKENSKKEECDIAEYFNKRLKNVQKFGCSDCKCKSHLFYGPLKEIKKILLGYNMKKYTIKSKY